MPKYPTPCGCDSYEMTPRDKIQAEENAKRVADMDRITNCPSYIYDNTNYAVEYPKDESK